MDTVAKGQVFAHIWTVENKVMWIFKDLWIMVTSAKEYADPIALLHFLTGNLSVLSTFTEQALNRTIAANTLFEEWANQ